ncbi:MAG: chemotaxis protein histidine kinaselike protein [Candidatus Saccharibacteria bacterium]|nr:chemotaxis protein histidine kinaselike protein [Candidatus Saccharibacteria bacterium]
MPKVLLIEPDVVLAKTYKAALEHAGHDVVAARSAQGAVHACDDAAPDVVVLELQLVRHNGIEFLHEFRSYPEWQNIPIVLHTMTPPSSLHLSTDMTEQLGVADYLYKPSTSLQKLIRRINGVVTPA